MSRQITKRANAIDKEFDLIVKDSSSAVSKLVSQTAAARLFIVFLHDNLLSSKGDISEGDRIDLRDGLVPLYPQIEECLTEIASLFSIHDDDPAVWQANFDTYLVNNPAVLDEALNRFPKVG
tara:strand:+ start:67 stop:432 length:366 start_codon:yes stop_codon:yes gene_type:complete